MTATVAVGTGPIGVAVDPSTHTVYVVNRGDKTVSVINGASNSVTTTIAVGRCWEVAVDPSTHIVYVTNGGDNTVSVIDGATNTVTATVTAGIGPAGVAVDPSTYIVYVTNSGDGTMSVITSTPDTDLAMGPQPPNIKTPATSLAGATVTYPVPGVTDEDATLPLAICTPASGSTFPVGTTKVTCSVTDADDTPSTVTKTFKVIVQDGADAQLSDLAMEVNGVGPGTTLADKIHAAQIYLASGHVTHACSTLSAFIHEVQTQTGKTIHAGLAARLIADAERIQAVLSC